MKTTLLYGKDGLTIEVPDRAVIIEPKHLDGLADEEKAVREALQNPIGTPPLREMVKSTDRVAIVISDITRPTPNESLFLGYLMNCPTYRTRILSLLTEPERTVIRRKKNLFRCLASGLSTILKLSTTIATIKKPSSMWEEADLAAMYT